MKIFLIAIIWIVVDLTIFQLKTIFKTNISSLLALWLIFTATFPTVLFLRACASFMAILSEPDLTQSVKAVIVLLSVIYLTVKIFSARTTKRLTK